MLNVIVNYNHTTLIFKLTQNMKRFSFGPNLLNSRLYNTIHFFLGNLM